MHCLDNCNSKSLLRLLDENAWVSSLKMVQLMRAASALKTSHSVGSSWDSRRGGPEAFLRQKHLFALFRCK